MLLNLKVLLDAGALMVVDSTQAQAVLLGFLSPNNYHDSFFLSKKEV